MVLEADSLQKGSAATSTLWLGHSLVRRLGFPIGFFVTRKNYACYAGATFELEYLLQPPKQQQQRTRKKSHNLVYFDDGWYSGSQASIVMNCINKAAASIMRARNTRKKPKVHVWATAVFGTDKAQTKILARASHVIPHIFIPRKIKTVKELSGQQKQQMSKRIPKYLLKTNLVNGNQTLAIPAHKTPNGTSLLFSNYFETARKARPAVYKRLLV
jgi:hypothetical protein